jgi:hypothetical protein
LIQLKRPFDFWSTCQLRGPGSSTRQGVGKWRARETQHYARGSAAHNIGSADLGPAATAQIIDTRGTSPRSIAGFPEGCTTPDTYYSHFQELCGRILCPPGTFIGCAAIRMGGRYRVRPTLTRTRFLISRFHQFTVEEPRCLPDLYRGLWVHPDPSAMDISSFFNRLGGQIFRLKVN